MVNLALLKAAFYKPYAGDNELPVLPESSISKNIRINPTHCENYNRVVNWKLGIASVIHPNYLQVLTLPMQLSMMVNKPFPFKPMGLVHLANIIEVNRLPEQSARLRLKTSFSGLQWHKKGWVFAVLSEGFVDGQLAISGTSFYLSRQKHTIVGAQQESEGSSTEAKSKEIAISDFSVLTNFNEMKTTDYAVDMSLPSGIGRKYARVSGDFNPIHLTAWSAKLMGFKKAIAHGMYSKAMCLSHVLKQQMADQTHPFLTSRMQISTQFMQPIYLPTKCELKVANTNSIAEHSEKTEKETKSIREVNFSLISNTRSKKREHLRSNIIINN